MSDRVTYRIWLDQSQLGLAEWQSKRLTTYHDQFKDRDDPRRRIWHPRHDDIGQYAEMTFSELYGLPPHLELNKKNDGRVDFQVGTHTIDIKGASRDYGLAREVGKWHAEILVLGRVDLEEGWVRLEGWVFDEEITKAPPVQLRNGGVFNHRLYAYQLNGMDQLEAYLGLVPTVT